MTLFLSRLFLVPALVLPLVLSSVAGADIKIISTRTLKSTAHQATFVEMKKQVVLPGAPKNEISYLTDTRFAYTVPTPAQIESFAVVQWIRGCIFNSEYKNARVEKSITFVREHFGKIVPFKHAVWQIDSDSTDPIYSADPDYGRFALLRWNQNPASLDAEKATYYAKAKPPHGSVFVTDLPSTAFLATGTGLRSGSAQNVSLEFQTCLYKTTDLPLITTPEGAGIDRTRALWCVSWDHKYVWDFSRAKMAKPSQIDPVCLY